MQGQHGSLTRPAQQVSPTLLVISDMHIYDIYSQLGLYWLLLYWLYIHIFIIYIYIYLFIYYRKVQRGDAHSNPILQFGRPWWPGKYPRNVARWQGQLAMQGRALAAMTEWGQMHDASWLAFLWASDQLKEHQPRSVSGPSTLRGGPPVYSKIPKLQKLQHF